MNISFLSPNPAATGAPRPHSPQDPLAQVEILFGQVPSPSEIAQVLVLEAEEPATWLQGGELVLTGLTFLAGVAPSWIDGLAAARAAGLLACGTGEVPEALVARARDHGLPLLRHDGESASVARQLQRQQASGRPWLLAQCMARQQEWIRQAVGGATPTRMLEELAADLGRPLLLEDTRFNRLAVAGDVASHGVDEDEDGSPDDLILAIQRHPEWSTFREGRQPLEIQAPGGTRTLWPVMKGERWIATLMVLGAPQRRDEIHLARIGGACAALAIVAAQLPEESDPRGHFFLDLLQRPGAFSRGEVQRRAHWLGMPLAQRYWPMAVAFDRSLPLPQAEALRQKLQTTLAAILSFRQCIIVPQTFGASILVPVTADPPGIDQMRRLALTIRDRLGAQGDTVSVGVGLAPGDLLALGRQHQEAVQALRIGRTLHGAGQVHCFDDMGVYRMLYQFAADRSPGAFLCEALSRLMAYDQQADKELVKTLGAFLDCNGNLTETSERLFIHRNTLKYRLERIRDITQVDLDTAETRLMLHIGLKMQQILDAQAG
ncbi:MAG: helix-turn-helix domain-containing protein [Candidatus Sericytochromatia bacterium]|nr:helix-turn-helix domain-containing protein [Candidatus Sericytochromatia bacterium]